MANNYLQFNEAITLKSEEEKRWVISYLELLELFEEEDREIGEHSPETSEYERMLGRYSLEDGDSGLSFQWDIDSKLELWMYAEESGNADHVALFMQEYLAKFNPEGAFSITYSTTCSKPRLGEFGGGAAFVTAEKIEWIDSHDWVIEKWEIKREAAKEKREEDRG